MRQGRRRHQCGVSDPDLVMRFVFVLKPPEDRNRIGNGRLFDVDRLKAAGQGGVLLDVFFIFVERGGADAVQFAARQRGLKQVRGIHGAVGLAGADQGVHLVDKQNVGACRGGHFLQHGLEALLELAAIFGARDQRAKIEREEFLVVQALRHVAVDDAQREPLDDRGLADARLADQHRIVLGPARQHLDGSADFLIAPNHRIKLAVAGSLGQIARIFLQRVVGVFRRRRVRRCVPCAAPRPRH